MKIHVLFGQRKEAYEGEYGPEVLLAWDEFTADENPDGFHEAVQKAMKANENEMQAMILVDLQIDQSQIRSLLVPTRPTLHAEIV